ncbi:MAG: hypothetical protein IT342_20060 [Candidatus Melainabacteria bacterium]|nr:hypothetical protein [Candidatus Melainabacteria bacterium]
MASLSRCDRRRCSQSFGAGDEHGILESSTKSISLNIGDRVELIPSHIDACGRR